MESRTFIKQAADLQRRIKDMATAGYLDIEPTQDSRQAIQKDLSQTFTGLQNATLPSAYQLRDAAMQAGYTIDPKILHRIQQAEGCWQ